MSGSRTQRGQHYGSLNDHTSNYPGSPPPPYTVPTPPPSDPPRNPSYNEEHASSSDETASLVNGNKVKRHSKARIAQMVFFAIMLTVLFTATSVLSVAVKRDITEWQHVHNEMMRDITHLREQKGVLSDDLQHLREAKSAVSEDLQHLRETKSAVSDDLQRLRIQREDERQEWKRERDRERRERERERDKERREREREREVERREWEREREANEQRRRGHVPFWGNARLLTAECPEDHIRQYDAPMHNLLVEDDWYAACMNTAIDIAGRGLASPRTCMNYGLDDGVRGYWSIEVNSSEC